MDYPQVVWWKIEGQEGKAVKIDPPIQAPMDRDASIAKQDIHWDYNQYGDPLFLPAGH